MGFVIRQAYVLTCFRYRPTCHVCWTSVCLQSLVNFDSPHLCHHSFTSFNFGKLLTTYHTQR